MGHRARVGGDYWTLGLRRRRRARTVAEELGLSPSDAADSLRAAMAAYLEAMAVVQLKPLTLFCRARDYRLFHAWCEERGLSRPGDITRPVLERYQRHLYYFRKPNGQPLAVTRQITQLSHLKSLFRWLARQNLVLANPAADLVMPRAPKRLPRYVLSVAEVEKVLAVPDVDTLVGLRDRAVLELFWATGLRRGEIARLLVADVQHERGTVFVREGKGLKDRVVPVSARALLWVRRYVDEVRPRYVLLPDEGQLFLSDAGLPVTLNFLTQSVRAYLDAAGIEAEGSCHLFRHACATQMLEGGADVRFVQELLGHASLETTQVYTRVAISKLRAVYEATHPAAKPAPAPPVAPGPGGEAAAEAAAAEEFLEKLHEEAAEEEH